MIGLVYKERLTMFDVYCFNCQEDMVVSQELFFGAASPDEWVCDTCIDYNEEVSSWYGGYEYEDYVLTSAGWGSDEDY
jgi:hypothetical protein